MKNIRKFGFLTFLVFVPQSLFAGTVRDGGDEPIRQPHWQCHNEDNSITVSVNHNGKEVQVAGSSNFVFASIYQNTDAVLAPTSVMDANGLTFGTTVQWIQFENSQLVLALSIYLESNIPSSDGTAQSPHLYRGRISMNWDHLRGKAIELVCKRNIFAAHWDSVDSPHFD